MQIVFILLFSLFLQTTATEKSQKQVAHAAALDTVKAVSAIKTKFVEMDAKRKSYSQYMPLAREKGKVWIGYFEGNTLKMITANMYGDSGKVEADEYLDETGVILVYAKVSLYEGSMALDPRTKVSSMSENWYYFKNEQLIKWVSGGKVVPAGSPEFKQKSAFYKAVHPATKALFADFSKLTIIK